MDPRRGEAELLSGTESESLATVSPASPLYNYTIIDFYALFSYYHSPLVDEQGSIDGAPVPEVLGLECGALITGNSQKVLRSP